MENNKNIVGFEPTICINKTYGKNGKEINNEKVIFRGRIYTKISDNGKQMCYAITNNRI